MLVGAERDFSRTDDDCRYVLDLGLLREENGALATTLAGKLKVVKNYRGGRATVSSSPATDMEGYKTFTVTLEPVGRGVHYPVTGGTASVPSAADATSRVPPAAGGSRFSATADPARRGDACWGDALSHVGRAH